MSFSWNSLPTVSLRSSLLLLLGPLAAAVSSPGQNSALSLLLPHPPPTLQPATLAVALLDEPQRQAAACAALRLVQPSCGPNAWRAAKRMGQCCPVLAAALHFALQLTRVLAAAPLAGAGDEAAAALAGDASAVLSLACHLASADTAGEEAAFAAAVGTTAGSLTPRRLLAALLQQLLLEPRSMAPAAAAALPAAAVQRIIGLTNGFAPAGNAPAVAADLLRGAAAGWRHQPHPGRPLLAYLSPTAQVAATVLCLNNVAEALAAALNDLDDRLAAAEAAAAAAAAGAGTGEPPPPASAGRQAAGDAGAASGVEPCVEALALATRLLAADAPGSAVAPAALQQAAVLAIELGLQWCTGAATAVLKSVKTHAARARRRSLRSPTPQQQQLPQQLLPPPAVATAVPSTGAPAAAQRGLPAASLLAAAAPRTGAQQRSKAGTNGTPVGPASPTAAGAQHRSPPAGNSLNGAGTPSGGRTGGAAKAGPLGSPSGRAGGAPRCGTCHTCRNPQRRAACLARPPPGGLLVQLMPEIPRATPRRPQAAAPTAPPLHPDRPSTSNGQPAARPASPQGRLAPRRIQPTAHPPVGAAPMQPPAAAGPSNRPAASPVPAGGGSRGTGLAALLHPPAAAPHLPAAAPVAPAATPATPAVQARLTAVLSGNCRLAGLGARLHGAAAALCESLGPQAPAAVQLAQPLWR